VFAGASVPGKAHTDAAQCLAGTGIALYAEGRH